MRKGPTTMWGCWSKAAFVAGGSRYCGICVVIDHSEESGSLETCNCRGVGVSRNAPRREMMSACGGFLTGVGWRGSVSAQTAEVKGAMFSNPFVASLQVVG